MRVGAVAALAYLAFALFAPVSFIDMDHHHDAMRDCPFMRGKAVLCDMSPLVHIARLQAMLVATLSAPFATLLLVLAALCIISIVLYGHVHSPPWRAAYRHTGIPIAIRFFGLLLGSTVNPRAP